MRDEGPGDYTYLWMIDLLPDDPRVFLEIVVSRPVEETFLFSFPIPQFTPFLVRIERDRVLYLSIRGSIKSALKQQQPDMTVAMPFDAGTPISELLQRTKSGMLQGVRDETVSLRTIAAMHKVINSKSSDSRMAADASSAPMAACQRASGTGSPTGSAATRRRNSTIEWRLGPPKSKSGDIGRSFDPGRCTLQATA